MSLKDELHQLVERLPESRRKKAKKLLQQLCQPQASLSAEPATARPMRPIEEIAAEHAAKVPAEEWERLPEDLIEQLDHYIYGTPKR